ncbi:mab-21 domain-containing protein [Trichonephila clavata]|uniref:Mab-21 domain-containing protein n=1 Tax=Trichonephila clavata TaxID=2740835 RepID=A0A8X6KGB3_TRICU|nr:mab-21 domain-containing protein [Trichonephila clavata]
MSFITEKTVMCHFCEIKGTIEDNNFPEELHALLCKYRIPQILWVCDSCLPLQSLKPGSKNRLNLEDDVQLLKKKVEELESRMNNLTFNTEFSSEEAVNTSFEREYSIGHASTGPKVYRKVDVDSPGEFHRSRSASPNSSCSFTSDDNSPKKNKEAKEALKIMHAIINEKIKIDENESVKKDYKTGSSYNGLRISAASEYDINFVFKPPGEISLQVEYFEETPVFAKIKWNKVKELHDSKRYILKFFEKNSEDGYFNPEKVKSWFQGLIDTFVLSNPVINGIKQIKSFQSGPARTVKLVTNDGYVLDIDLMPAFLFSYDVLTETPIKKILEKYSVDKSKEFWHLVPKLCQGEEPLLAYDCKFTWRIDFPEVEKIVLHNKQCAKSVIKLLKLLRDKQNWVSIASYHLKTIVLLEVDKNPALDYWSGEVFFDRFLEAMKHLKEYVKNKRLPYFLCAEYNLFHLINKEECKNISDRLDRIISDIEADPNSLRKYFLKP